MLARSLVEHLLVVVDAHHKCQPTEPISSVVNENTNGLLRQYFPKGEGMGIYSQSQLDEIANKLNTRPRKTLGFNTPAEVFEQALH